SLVQTFTCTGVQRSDCAPVRSSAESFSGATIPRNARTARASGRPSKRVFLIVPPLLGRAPPARRNRRRGLAEIQYDFGASGQSARKSIREVTIAASGPMRPSMRMGSARPGWGQFSKFGFVVFGGVGEVAQSWGALNSSDLLPSGGLGARFLLARENQVNFR